MTIPASAYGTPTVERSWVTIHCGEIGNHGGTCRRILMVVSSTARLLAQVKCGRCGNITEVVFPT